MNFAATALFLVPVASLSFVVEVGLSGFCLRFSLAVVVQLAVIKTCDHGSRAIELKVRERFGHE